MRQLFSCLFLILLFTSAFGQDNGIPKKPSPPKLVNDLADILSDSQENSLEKKLRDFNNSTSTQIVVVTVQSLNGYDRADFTYQIGETWGVGQKGFDNGVVLMVKPKYANEKGQTYIAVGYGLEGVIPDAIAKRIVEREMIPYFKMGNMYQGIDEATNVLMSLASQEFTADEYNASSKKIAIPIGMVVFLVFFLGIIIFGLVMQARSYSAYHNVPFWTALALSMASGRSHRGRYDDFNHGGGSFGGGSSFGGFGGGSFGGGGAGGSW